MHRRALMLFAMAAILALAACGGGGSSSSATGGNAGGGGGGNTPPPPPATNIPPPPVLAAVDVLTYHNDNARTGLNSHETVLTPANVDSHDFGKVGFFPVDGKVDAQPLYVGAYHIHGGAHNVLIVATEHDSVYALDADSGKQYWHVSLLKPGETTSDAVHRCGQVTPEIGITATPVIDLAMGANGTVFAVAMSKRGGSYYQRLHALDLLTGAESSPATTIQASFPGSGDASTGGVVPFQPEQYKERAGLLLANGVIYTTWASHCDDQPYTGWIIAYDEATLTRSAVLNIAPNGEGASIWAAGAAPAADAAGNIYFLAANGTFESTLDVNGFPTQGDYGNAFMKLSTTGGTLTVADYFNMHDTNHESFEDQDLGSGGAMLLPDMTDGTGHVKHLAVGAGKDARIYVVDRDDMGKFDPSSDHIWQELPNGLADPEFGMPAYFNLRVYYGAISDVLRAFKLSKARLSTQAESESAHGFQYPGATPGISSHGTHDGIVWATENGPTAGLYAFDATDLARELYDSNQAGSRDQFGAGNKFVTPTIANGKVYVATTDGVAVFGLLR